MTTEEKVREVNQYVRTTLGHPSAVEILFVEDDLIEPTYDCEDCLDTGEIEIMGGSDTEEWGVVDIKRCHCQE